MTEDQFRSYVAAFNASDFDGFGRFYADDVVFELGSRKTITGRDNILAFYRQVKAHIVEVVIPIGVVIGPRNVAMYCSTTFDTVVDWPDFELWPTFKGDHRYVETIAWYELDETGERFTHIRGGRFKP
jgi:hypothetical protein